MRPDSTCISNIHLSNKCLIPWASYRQEAYSKLIDSVQSLSCVWLFVTLWTAGHQTYLSIPNSQRLLKLMSIELMMPSNHLNLCHPLLLLPSIFPSIRVCSLHQMAKVSWSFSFNICPSNEYSGLIALRIAGMSEKFNGDGNVSIPNEEWNVLEPWCLWSGMIYETFHYPHHVLLK